MKTYDRKLRIFHDVAYERATNDFYVGTIKPALSESRVLIVLCTRSARERLPDGRENFLEREVNDFCASDQRRTIIPVLVHGDMSDPLPGDLEKTYPNLQIVDMRALRGARRYWFANWGRLDDEVIKIVGPLFDVPLASMTDLRREEARRGQRRALILAASSFAIAAALLILAFVALAARVEAKRQLVGNLIEQGRLLYPTAPSAARVHFARAVEEADSSGVLGFGRADASIARWWLGAPSHHPSPVILRHGDQIVSAAWSPDGASVVTGCNDGSAQVWNASSGKPVGKAMRHAKGITHVAFDPSGRRVVTSSWDGTARIWNTATGEPITPPMKSDQAINSAVFDPAGKRIVTASWDDTVRVWNAETGQPEQGVAVMHTKFYANYAEFDPKGVTIISGDAGGQVELWNATTGEPIWPAALTHDNHVNDVRFNGNGRVAVSAGDDHTARLWDVLGARQIGEAMVHSGIVRTARISHDGSRVVTASDDGTARIWDSDTGKPITPPLAHGAFVLGATWSADDRWVITASSDGTARVWEARTGAAVGIPLDHPDVVRVASFDPTGHRALTAGEDGTARVWSLDTMTQLDYELVDENNVDSPVSSIDISSDGLWVATGNNHGTIAMAALDGTNRVAEHHATPPIGVVAFSPRGDRLLVAAYENIELLRVGSWQTLVLFDVGADPIASAAWSPDGTRIAIGLTGGDVLIWNATTGKTEQTLRHVQNAAATEKAIKALAWSPDSRRVVSAGADGDAVLWRVDGTRIGAPMHHDEALSTVAVSADGSRIATAGIGKSVHFWNGSTAAKVSGALPSHGSGIEQLAFSPDGSKICTASADGSARIWSVRDGHASSPRLRHKGAVWTCTWSADGKRVLTASQDRTAQVWDSASGDPIGAPLRHSKTITQAIFDPGGTHAVTAGFDGRARIWSVEADRRATGELSRAIERETGLRYDSRFNGVRALTPEEWEEHSR